MGCSFLRLLLLKQFPSSYYAHSSVCRNGDESKTNRSEKRRLGILTEGDTGSEFGGSMRNEKGLFHACVKWLSISSQNSFPFSVWVFGQTEQSVLLTWSRRAFRYSSRKFVGVTSGNVNVFFRTIIPKTSSSQSRIHPTSFLPSGWNGV